LRAALEATCRALDLAATETQIVALVRYLELLERWNATYNLTAVRDPAEMRVQHLADCLAVITPLRRQLAQGRLLDVGSGGGLPGVVVAVMLPAVDVTCVDSVGKKAAFIRQAAGTLNLPNLRAVHSRIENLREPSFDVVTARAFASLAHFIALTRPCLLDASGVWLAMKGRTPNDEIAALAPDIDVFHVEPLSVPGLDAQRCLVWMRPRPTSP